MMDKLKFGLFSIVMLALVGILGYWAIGTIKSGPEFQSSQKIAQLQKDKEDLTKQVADLTQQLNSFKLQTENTVSSTGEVVTQPASNVSKPTPKTTSTTYKNQSLINQLQSLVTNNVSMKLKSIGTRVGTVQNFLNIYNNTSNKIDNDYGASTVKAVVAFQKDQGLTADGQASTTTFNKMISWLKKQG